MDQAEKLGLEVLAWTVDDPAEVKRLEALKVKRITTNRPQWLREQVQK
jgi:glycerophosphoryl diester phosphodiesterase